MMIRTVSISAKKPFTFKRSICTRVYDVIHEPFPVIRNQEETEHVHFLRATNTVVFSENYIRWAGKSGETISVCIKPDGCTPHELFEISKDKNPDDYEYINQLLGFDEPNE